MTGRLCLDRPLPEPMIDEHQPRHRLDHWDGPGQDARIVAAARLKVRRFAADGNGLLLPGNRSHRLEGDPKDDVLAVGDAALHAAAPVGERTDAVAFLRERVVVLGTFEERAREAGTDL